MDKKIVLIHVGKSGIPFSNGAAVNRIISIISIFSNDRFENIVINNRPLDIKNTASGINKKGNFANFNYYFTTNNIYKSQDFIRRRIDNILGRLNEFSLIFKLVLSDKIDYMLFYPSGRLLELLIYSVFSKIFKFPLVIHTVEYRSSHKNRKSLFLKLNDYFFDNYFMYFVDGSISISDFLINKIKSKKINLPVIKIPPVIDFRIISNYSKSQTFDYFLYVGNPGYSKAINLILDSFELVNSDYRLVLVLNGNTKEINNRINKHSKKNLIDLKSNLPYNKLIELNINAKALLLPLSDSIQDRARFPQKLSEYLASANPIITTNHGEIKNYFTDGVDAIIAKSDSPEEFSKKMKFVIDNPQKAIEIGKEGYSIGFLHFNTDAYKISLTNFILKEINI